MLSDKGRAALIDSLGKAEARIKAGEGIDYDPRAFKDRLTGIYRGGGR